MLTVIITEFIFQILVTCRVNSPSYHLIRILVRLNFFFQKIISFYFFLNFFYKKHRCSCVNLLGTKTWDEFNNFSIYLFLNSISYIWICSAIAGKEFVSNS